MKKLSIIFVSIVVFSGALQAQSGPEYIRYGIHNANQVFAVFRNTGVIGWPANKGNRGAWKYPNNGYLGEVSPLVGADVSFKDASGKTRTFKTVVTCDLTDRPQANPRNESPSGTPWVFEPVVGYMNANQDQVAMSTNKSSWPAMWADKLTDATDPGWSGSWNGYFGKRTSADQESYYVMDDNQDQRWNYPNYNDSSFTFHPDSTKLSRNGLGLVMRVRGMQWQFPAQDNIFWLYEIENTGTTDYSRVVFGMLVGTYVGVTSTEGYSEYDNDWSFYDVKSNLTYTGNYSPPKMRNPLWTGPVGMVGYAFLESPGNAFDGIDNDGDSDSSAFSAAAQKFTPASFDSVTLVPGMTIVLVRDDYSRYTYVIPNKAVDTIYTRGAKTVIFPGVTKVAEGNTLTDITGNTYINPNAYDGIDNNFNGLIDENSFVHYRQIKRDNKVTPPTVLLDVLRPVRYINYVTGAGTSTFSLIDERRDDRIDNDRDWVDPFDDLGRDGVAGTLDFGEGDHQPTSGYDNFGNDTQLPGESNIDKTDVHESDQIGLTSFYYFAPANQISLGNKNDLWNRMAPGQFAVPPSIVNNRPINGEDGDFIYGSGYFPLRSKSIERFSIALVYGGGTGGSIENDIADLLLNKKAVQQIYDGNYQFQQPPQAPVVTAVAGDKKVTLYWDRKAEDSVDPVQRVKDFEGYKIYRSTDPLFSDINTITNADGIVKGYKPLAQFDKADNIKGYFQAVGGFYQQLRGYTYDLGTDNGLVHSYVDNDVENGRRYFYAVVAYDRGNASLDIFPTENTKIARVKETGEIEHDDNVAVVVPGVQAAGYQRPASGISLNHNPKIGTGTVQYQVLDPEKISGHSYRVEFWDSLIDTVDNNSNGKVDVVDSTEWRRTTSYYSVLDLDQNSEIFTVTDSSLISLTRKNLIGSTVEITNSANAKMDPSTYTIDTVRGTLKGKSLTVFPKGTYTIVYRYYPIYRNPYMQGSPYTDETTDAEYFDGVRLVFNNHWAFSQDSIIWMGPNAYVVGMTPTAFPDYGLVGYPRPASYRFEFASHPVDTSMADPVSGLEAIPAYFRIYNTTENRYVKFYYVDFDWTQGNYGAKGFGRISPSDELLLLEPGPNGGLVNTWDINFNVKLADLAINKDTVYNLTDGNYLRLVNKFPFRKGDVFDFATVKPKIDDAVAEQTLSKVKVVPNPYISATSHEAPLPTGITSGRGERKITFTNIPVGAKISIFTSRGEHVITLQQDGSMANGNVDWNLKTKENLDIAFGVYFYYLDSSVGTKTGKFAVIK